MNHQVMESLEYYKYKIANYSLQTSNHNLKVTTVYKTSRTFWIEN